MLAAGQELGAVTGRGGPVAEGAVSLEIAAQYDPEHATDQVPGVAWSSCPFRPQAA